MLQSVATVMLVLIAAMVSIWTLAPIAGKRWILRRLGRFAPSRLQRSLASSGCGTCAARNDVRPPSAS
ncbi:MAG: hypothetical protein ACO3CV_00300 [Steroidobacteraceae bacterium]